MNLKHTLELEVYRKADNPTRTFDHFRNMALRYKKSKNYNPDSYIVWLEELANRPKIMYNV
jgi:hypothetical protein